MRLDEASAQLPIVGKDIVFVQDASRSLARERLHFCKEGLKEALGTVSAADRFNVVSFRDNATFCFGLDWATPTTENFQHAIAFIDSLDSRGDTDLFRSLKSLTALPRDPARPLIAIVITDGKATTGITASTRIIGEFSKLNDDMSLYVLGTHAKANAYLLDMLAPMNDKGGNNLLETLYVAKGKDIHGVTVGRASDHVPVGTIIVAR